jgi:glycosyltransferase involved in cell wall biosynthesis
MKILHVIPSLSPELGGPGQVALNLVNSLRTLNVDVEIVTTNHSISGTLEVPINQRTDYIFDAENSLSAPVWFLPYTPPPLKEFIFSKALTGWLWRNLPSYDLVDNHYLFSYSSTCSAAIARWNNIPYTIRTMGQLTPWALAQSATKKRLYTFLIERHNLQRASGIHCTAPAEALDVRKLGIDSPTITIPLGVVAPAPIENAKEKLHHTYGIPSEIPTFLFLSRLHHKKQPDLLLKAAKQFLAKQPCHVILAGKGEPQYIEQLKNLVEMLNIENHVTFAGFVTGYDKNLLLQGADVFVLPSHSENFGIVVAEALISELPVIITSGIQISAEINAANAGLVVEGEVLALSSALHQIVTNPRLRDELRRNGVHLAKSRYSWIAIAQELSSVYKNIISEKEHKKTA